MRVPWAVLLPALLAAGSCCYAPAAWASQGPASAVDPKPAGPPANPKESEKPAVALRSGEGRGEDAAAQRFAHCRGQ